MTARRPDRGSSRALVLAIAASLALHGAVLLLVRGGARELPRPEDVPIELTFVEPPADARAPLPHRHDAAPSPSAKRGERVSRDRTPSPPAERGERVRGEGGPVPPPPSATDEDLAETRRWFAERGLAGARDAEEARRRLGVPVPDGFRAKEGAAAAKERVEDMLAGITAGDISRYPDADWTELRDRLAAGFAAPRGAGGGKGGAVEGYLAAAETYGRTGSPLPATPDAPGRARPGADAASRENMGGSRELESLGNALDVLAARGAGGATRPDEAGGFVTIVAVTQDEDGVVVSAIVVRQSGSGEHDRLALAQARRLRGRALSPRLKGTTTEWAFTTERLVAPSGPLLGFAFDANFKPTAPHPLHGEIRTTVRLVAVRRAG